MKVAKQARQAPTSKAPVRSSRRGRASRRPVCRRRNSRPWRLEDAKAAAALFKSISKKHGKFEASRTSNLSCALILSLAPPTRPPRGRPAFGDADTVRKYTAIVNSFNRNKARDKTLTPGRFAKEAFKHKYGQEPRKTLDYEEVENTEKFLRRAIKQIAKLRELAVDEEAIQDARDRAYFCDLKDFLGPKVTYEQIAHSYLVKSREIDSPSEEQIRVVAAEFEATALGIDASRNPSPE